MFKIITNASASPLGPNSATRQTLSLHLIVEHPVVIDASSLARDTTFFLVHL